MIRIARIRIASRRHHHPLFTAGRVVPVVTHRLPISPSAIPSGIHVHHPMRRPVETARPPAPGLIPHAEPNAIPDIDGRGNNEVRPGRCEDDERIVVGHHHVLRIHRHDLDHRGPTHPILRRRLQVAISLRLGPKPLHGVHDLTVLLVEGVTDLGGPRHRRRHHLQHRRERHKRLHARLPRHLFGRERLDQLLAHEPPVTVHPLHCRHDLRWKRRSTEHLRQEGIRVQGDRRHDAIEFGGIVCYRWLHGRRRRRRHHRQWRPRRYLGGRGLRRDKGRHTGGNEHQLAG